MESLSIKLDDQFMPIVFGLKDRLRIQDEDDFITWVDSFKIGFIVNEYATQFLRTKLDFHPKWITKRSYNEDRAALAGLFCTHLYSLVRMTSCTSLDLIERAIIVLSELPDEASCDLLLRDMSRNVPIEMLLKNHNYQPNAIQGLDLFQEDCELFAQGVGNNLDVNFIKDFVDLVKLAGQSGR